MDLTLLSLWMVTAKLLVIRSTFPLGGSGFSVPGCSEMCVRSRTLHRGDWEPGVRAEGPGPRAGLWVGCVRSARGGAGVAMKDRTVLAAGDRPLPGTRDTGSLTGKAHLLPEMLRTNCCSVHGKAWPPARGQSADAAQAALSPPAGRAFLVCTTAAHPTAVASVLLYPPRLFLINFVRI